MSALQDFYLGALGAEIENAPPGELRWRMETYYCRAIMALEQMAQASPMASEDAKTGWLRDEPPPPQITEG